MDFLGPKRILTLYKWVHCSPGLSLSLAWLFLLEKCPEYLVLEDLGLVPHVPLGTGGWESYKLKTGESVSLNFTE